ncbi:hypothetical protein GCM10027021_38540 [Dyella kyungheensis]
MRDKPTERYIPAWRSCTSALPQKKTHTFPRAPPLSQAGRGRSGCIALTGYCGSAPCARQAYGAIHPNVAVAHRVRSHRRARRQFKPSALAPRKPKENTAAPYDAATN